MSGIIKFNSKNNAINVRLDSIQKLILKLNFKFYYQSVSITVFPFSKSISTLLSSSLKLENINIHPKFIK
jgi:hypothetical protein